MRLILTKTNGWKDQSDHQSAITVLLNRKQHEKEVFILTCFFLRVRTTALKKE